MPFNQNYSEDFQTNLHNLYDYLEDEQFEEIMPGVWEKRQQDNDSGGIAIYSVQIREETPCFRLQVSGYGSNELPNGLNATHDTAWFCEVAPFFTDYGLNHQWEWK